MFVVTTYTEQATALGSGVRPDWSPVDDRIIFQRFGEVFTVNPDGSDLDKVAETSGTLIGWSLDGNRYAWWTGVLGSGLTIHIKEADSGSVQAIELDDTRIDVGHWELSGIAVYSNSGWGQRESERTYVSILNVNTHELLRGVGLCTEGTSDWTLDGRPVCSWWGYSVGDWGEYTGWINAVGDNGESITVAERLLQVSYPSWSPDGRSFVFDLELPDSRELFIAEGEEFDAVRQITHSGQAELPSQMEPCRRYNCLPDR